MRKLIGTLALVVAWAFLFAQAPQSFNYQGVARDLSGNPLPNQEISLRLSVLQGSSSGQSVYREEHNVITNGLGLFAVEVGNGSNPVFAFDDIPWGNGPLFLQTEIDIEGNSNYQLVGTSQLLSVPYALYAENAGEYWEKDQFGLVFKDENQDTDVKEGVRYEAFSTDPVTGEQVRSVVWLHGFYNNYAPTNNTYPGPMIMLNQNRNGSSFPSDRTWIVRSTEGLEFRVQEIDESFYGFVNFFFSETGKFGIGTAEPKASLQVQTGDIYLPSSNQGVIMTSPDGQCWKLVVQNDGALSTQPVNCPN